MLLKEMADEQLVETYWFHRRMQANAGDMASLPMGPRARRRCASSFGYHNNRMCLAANILRKRGVSPLASKWDHVKTVGGEVAKG